jgi:hypothetical protein
MQNHSALGPLPYPFLWGKAIPPNNCKSVSHIDFRHLWKVYPMPILTVSSSFSCIVLPIFTIYYHINYDNIIFVLSKNGVSLKHKLSHYFFSAVWLSIRTIPFRYLVCVEKYIYNYWNIGWMLFPPYKFYQFHLQGKYWATTLRKSLN